MRKAQKVSKYRHFWQQAIYDENNQRSEKKKRKKKAPITGVEPATFAYRTIGGRRATIAPNGLACANGIILCNYPDVFLTKSGFKLPSSLPISQYWNYGPADGGFVL